MIKIKRERETGFMLMTSPGFSCLPPESKPRALRVLLKFLPVLTLCLITVFQVKAQANDTLRLTLDEALNSAVTGNADILIAELEIQRAQSQRRAVTGGFLPQIGVDGQYTRNLKRPVFFLPAGSNFPGGGGGGGGGTQEGSVIEAGFDNSYTLTGQATLPLYSRELIANARAAKTAVSISERGLDINMNDATAQVRKAYYDALLARESLEVLEISLENAQQNFINTQNQFAQELVPEYDVIRAQVQVENVRPDILQGENDYEAAISNLKLLANIPDEVPVVLAQTLEGLMQGDNAELLAQYTIQSNPNLLQLNAQAVYQQEQIKVQQSTFFPSLAAFGNYAYQTQANDFNFGEYLWVNTSAVGLQLSIPVFQGLTRLRQVEQARIDLKQTEIQRKYLTKSLTIQARNALNRVQRARASMEAQQVNIAQAQRGFEIAQVSYRSGYGTLIEVNDAELALTQARLGYIQVIYEYLNALADFKQLTGNESNE
ncbi:TolC family protein [Pontibacter diazotrophicus]|nr:TolC family protein [Pontibacter diazotrophicus]